MAKRVASEDIDEPSPTKKTRLEEEDIEKDDADYEAAHEDEIRGEMQGKGHLKVEGVSRSRSPCRTQTRYVFFLWV